MLSREEKEELISLAGSSSFKEDMRRVKEKRHNPFMKNGEVDIDAYISFLTEYNEFINHQPKLFKPIICTNMKL